MNNTNPRSMEAISFQPELRAQRLDDKSFYSAIDRVSLSVIEGVVGGKNKTFTQTMANDEGALIDKVLEESEEVTRAYREESVERLVEETADVLQMLDIQLEVKGLSLVDALNVWSMRGVSTVVAELNID